MLRVHHCAYLHSNSARLDEARKRSAQQGSEAVAVAVLGAVGVRYACSPCQTSATHVATHIMPCGLCHFGCALPFCPASGENIVLLRRDAVKSKYGKHVGIPMLVCLVALLAWSGGFSGERTMQTSIGRLVIVFQKGQEKCSESVRRLISFHTLKCLEKSSSSLWLPPFPTSFSISPSLGFELLEAPEYSMLSP